jgi:hypothetical protein
MQSTLHSILLSSPDNLFDAFMAQCQSWYEQPAHTFTEMRNRENKKIRGDIFEEFTVLYLKHVLSYKNVWRLEDVPNDILTQLSMKRQDMGIDIVAQTESGMYVAVQCKYKKHRSSKRNIVTWKSLSTFYALCMRTGPWDKYIVVTNCEYVRHQGKKTNKDLSVCIRKLRGITKEQWTRMCELQGNVLAPTPVPVQASNIVDEPAPAPEPKPKSSPKPKPKPKKETTPKPTLEELRALRLARFEKKEEE